MRRACLVLLLTFLVASAALAGDAPLDGWQRDSDYNKLFNSKTLQVVRGTVISLDRDLRPLPGMGAGFGVLIETTEKAKLALHIGPAWFTQNYRDDWKVQLGDQVEVRGSRIQMGDKEALMVVWGRKGDHVMTVRNHEGAPVWDIKLEGF